MSAALLGLAACGGQTTEAPKAADDAVTTSEDTPINIQVLDNDSASDLNSVTVTVTTPAEHGSTEVLSTKAIRYTPNANFNGADQFKYTIKDGQGRSDTATVRVTVNAVNDAPLIAYFQAVDQTGAELNSGQAPFSANLAWSVSDAEGDPLSCTLDFGDDSQQSVDCGGALLAHEYRKVGSYDATLTVSDGVNTTTASVSISAVSNYDITLRFETDLSESQREAFEWAARRWSEVIVGDLSDVNDYRLEEGACGNENTEVLDIDDLTIFVSVEPVDGEGGVLGSGGPCYLRSDSGLPYVGRVSFDSDDLDNLEDQGMLKSVILHEMGHVLGIGTIWEYFGLLDWEDGVDSCMDASDIYFIGNSASQEWQ
ncbi:Ig-like domain-containing protein, partial [Oceanithermus sp.]